MIVLKNVSPELRLRLQVIADSQKKFTPEENAEVWANLYHIINKKENRKVPISEFSKMYCKSESSIRSALVYEALHPGVRDLVMGGSINYTTALELSKLAEEEQYQMAMQIVLSPMSAKKNKSGSRAPSQHETIY
jgi:hypothetical protein